MYRKPSVVQKFDRAVSFVAAGQVKMVYGNGPLQGHPECVTPPQKPKPAPKPING